MFILLHYLNDKRMDAETSIDRRLLELENSYEYKQNKLQSDFDRRNRKLEHDYSEKDAQRERLFKDRNAMLLLKEAKLKKLLASAYPFKAAASMKRDIDLAVFEDTISYLKYKRHPALSAAEEVKKIKEKAKTYTQRYYEVLYQLDYLFSIFPELDKYVDNDEAMRSLDQYEGWDDFKANTDRSSDFLSKEEWNSLSVEERNQLALDRYKRRPKSNWVIGIEYEMYIDYILRNAGFKTIPSGSLNGLEDLGRDIIAFKADKEGNTVVYIIQCKNWSSRQGKEVHENVICQTFGTSIEYAIKHKDELFTNVVPVIYSTVPLSDIAKEFAKRLGVQVFITQKKEYPMIKCNINDKGEKIYHLPFDQQYYKTQINKPGEFYAWTVKEAVDAGFRRAFKYTGFS